MDAFSAVFCERSSESSGSESLSNKEEALDRYSSVEKKFEEEDRESETDDTTLADQVNETVTLKAFPVLDEFSAVFCERGSESSGSESLSNEEEAEDRYSSVEKQIEEEDRESESEDATLTDQVNETVTLKASRGIDAFSAVFCERGSESSGSENLSNEKEAEDRYSSVEKQIEEEDRESESEDTTLTDQVNETVTLKAFPGIDAFSAVFCERGSESSGSERVSNEEEAEDRNSSVEKKFEKEDRESESEDTTLTDKVNETVTLKAFRGMAELRAVFCEGSESSGSESLSNKEEALDRYSSVEKKFEEEDRESETDDTTLTDKTMNMQKLRAIKIEETEEVIGEHIPIEKLHHKSLHKDAGSIICNEDEAKKKLLSLERQFKETENETNMDQSLTLTQVRRKKLKQTRDTFGEESLFENICSKTQYKDILKLEDEIHRQSANTKLDQIEDLFHRSVFSEGSGVCLIRNRNLSHDQWSLLSSSLSQQKNETHRLIFDNVNCTEYECKGHYLNLSKHLKLQSVCLIGCSDLFLSHINPRLESCEIEDSNYSHEIMLSLSSCINRAVNVKTLKLCGLVCSEQRCKGHVINLSKHNNLRSLTMNETDDLLLSDINPHLQSCEIQNARYSHEILLSLSSGISRAVNLKMLKLCNLKCSNSGCDGHVTDLSKHNKLQSLTIEMADYLLLSDINPHLQSCEIQNARYSHKTLLSLSLGISRAVNLKVLKLGKLICSKCGCDGHDIDLSKHNKLQSITINMTDDLLLTDINPHLQSYEIQNARYSHENLLSLSLGISRAVNLEMLKLCNLKCSKSGCDGHVIDLSKHNKLQSLTMYMTDDLLLSDINPQIQSCEIQNARYSHKTLLSLSSGVSNAVNLKMLKLCNLKCSKSGCDGHVIDLSKHDKIQSLTMYMTDDLLLFDINPHLQSCEIQNTRFSHEILLSLLLGISRAVNLKILKLGKLICSKFRCDGHVIDLSKHNKLQSITMNMTDDLLLSDINPHLQSCEIQNARYSHKILLSLSLGISRAVNLKMLKLCNLKCSKSECEDHAIKLSKHDKLQKLKMLKLDHICCSDITCEGHAIDLSKHERLENIVICRSQNLYIKTLKYVPYLVLLEISDCTFSHEQWLSFSPRDNFSERLSVIFARNICTNKNCEGHSIILSGTIHQLTESHKLASRYKRHLYYTNENPTSSEIKPLSEPPKSNVSVSSQHICEDSDDDVKWESLTLAEGQLLKPLNRTRQSEPFRRKVPPYLKKEVTSKRPKWCSLM